MYSNTASYILIASLVYVEELYEENYPSSRPVLGSIYTSYHMARGRVHLNRSLVCRRANTQRLKLIHAHIHTYGQFTIINYPNPLSSCH